MADEPTSASVERAFQLINELEQAGKIGRHAIGGAFAFIYYAEPFETRDLDIFAKIPLGAPIYEFFRQLGCPVEEERVVIGGIPIQILPVVEPLIEEAVEQAREIKVGGALTRVFTAEHAVAAALQSNRAKDRMKILHLQESSNVPLDLGLLESILARHGLLFRWRQFEESTRG